MSCELRTGTDWRSMETRRGRDGGAGNGSFSRPSSSCCWCRGDGAADGSAGAAEIFSTPPSSLKGWGGGDTLEIGGTRSRRRRERSPPGDEPGRKEEGDKGQGGEGEGARLLGPAHLPAAGLKRGGRRGESQVGPRAVAAVGAREVAEGEETSTCSRTAVDWPPGTQGPMSASGRGALVRLCSMGGSGGGKEGGPGPEGSALRRSSEST
mmetsp:Transcript_37332/g.105329  ORF Transcript_37332/g.105329 Transcript_37332/m.105329 type:complete len:209 (+) Transcript_37332:1700-2326(+)